MGGAVCSAPFAIEVGISEVPDGSGSLRLLGAWPNPMQAAGHVRFEVAQGETQASVAIYDVAGRLVRDFGALQFELGEQTVSWDGRTDTGEPARSGMYFIRVSPEHASPIVAKILVAR